MAETRAWGMKESCINCSGVRSPGNGWRKGGDVFACYRTGETIEVVRKESGSCLLKFRSGIVFNV